MTVMHAVLLTQQDTSQCQKGWQDQVSIYPYLGMKCQVWSLLLSSFADRGPSHTLYS